MGRLLKLLLFFKVYKRKYKPNKDFVFLDKDSIVDKNNDLIIKDESFCVVMLTKGLFKNTIIEFVSLTTTQSQVIFHNYDIELFKKYESVYKDISKIILKELINDFKNNF